MTACPTNDQLERWLAEELAGPERDVLEGHVEACAPCQALVERLLNDTTPGGIRRPSDTARLSQFHAANQFLLELQAVVPGSGTLREKAANMPRPKSGRVGLPVVAGYDVLEEIGRGGMGVVYKARQQSLNRLVALKLLRAGPAGDAGVCTRLRTEAEAAARLQHPHIVQVHEIGDCDLGPYLAMEFVAGGNLANAINGKPQSERDSADLVATLARAVHHAHEHGIVHRDLKPSNILVVSAGVVGVNSSMTATDRSTLTSHQVKIADFGLARSLDEESNQTASSVILGTPSYMSPEQASGKRREIGPATDVYSLGAILYEVLTGHPPFIGETSFDTMMQVLHSEPISPRRLRPRLSFDLETICLKCLRKEPGKRYASAAALADDLERFRAGRAIHARPVTSIEQGWRWCRRNSRVAKLAAALVVAVAAGFAGVTWKWLDAEKHRQDAETAWGKEQDERKRKTDALEQAKTNLYFHSISLAHREWQASNVVHAEAILDECPADLRKWEWHYLKRLCHDETMTLRGHTDTVHAMAFSRDGSCLATAGNDGVVIVWDTGTGRRLNTTAGIVGNWSVLGFSDDGRRLVCGSKRMTVGAPFATDTTLAAWDVQTGQPVFQIRNPFVGFKIALNHGATRLLTASSAGITSVWDTMEGKELAKLANPITGAAIPAISPDGQLAAGMRVDGHLALWNVVTGAVAHDLGKHVERFASLDFSPDGRWLVGAREQAIFVWDVATGLKTRETIVSYRGAPSVQFSSNGERLLVRAGDREARILSPHTGRELHAVRINARAVTAAAIDRDGSHVAIGCPDGAVRIWAAADLGGARTLPRLANQRNVILSPDGNWIAALDQSGISVRSLVTGQHLGNFIPAGGTYPAAISTDGKQVACAENRKAIEIWDPATGIRTAVCEPSARACPPSPSIPPATYISRQLAGHAAFSPDCTLVASALTSESVQVWDTATGSQVCVLENIRAFGAAPVFTRDGRLIAVADASGLIRLFDSRTGHAVNQLAGHAGYVRSLDFDGTGDRIASGGSDGTVRVWDVATGRELFRLAGHTGMITAVAFNTDATRLVSTSYDKCVKVWDVAARRELLSLSDSTDIPMSARFSADGRRLVTLDSRGGAKVYYAD